ncbi:hypothetical protein BS47DRAFT_1379281 [Hydnum rufescens UP504]|uniref:Uncharacterized protein n=1 Tax=Hydnum rufescens UP504 TaxID=1448309 RepID=A0A9P6B922_9AGAM|nr:hypothetical protein BS47DRAFT_1379281 [Hydnum rufescens UP504]
MARGGVSPSPSKGTALGSNKKQKASPVTNGKVANTTQITSPEPSQPIDGQPESPPKPKPKTKKKGAKTRQRKRKSFFDHFLRGVFVSLTIYYVLVCPEDTRLENPTCRKLHDVRKALEPIIFTPINLAFSHPAVSPYVNVVKPHINEAIRLTSPYVQLTRAAIYPRYIILQRKLVPYFLPYTRRLEQEYDARVRPYISRVEPYIRQAQRHARPYLDRTSLALKQSYAKSLPYLRRAWFLAIEYWTKAQPYLVPIWEQIKEGPQWFIKHLGPRVAHLKSEYVDVQIRKIWAKIEELGGDRHTSKALPTDAVTIMPVLHSVFSSVEEVAEVFTASEFPAVSTTLSPSPSDVESVVPAHTTLHFVSDAPELEPEPENNPTPAELDVEEFIASLTEEEPSSRGAITPEDPIEPIAPFEDEAAREAKLIETREKRRNIEARHAGWEAKVHEQGKQGLQSVIHNITAIRERAIADISSSEGEIGSLVAAFKAAGAKGIKGTEAYARKLVASQYSGEEKVALFDRVVGKVEERYGENATSLSNTVAQWWADVRDKVDEEAAKHFKPVEDIAGEAQADIGMDYAWLDDVTPADWRRYHDLMHTAQAYGEDYKALANGTHPDSPEDPLPSALADLQNDLQETLVAFFAELQRVHHAGLRQFAGTEADDSGSSSSNKEPVFSILPVADARKEFADAPFIGRDREEVLSALHRAGEVVESKAPDSAPTPSQKPAAEIHEAIADGILDDIFGDAEGLYKFGAEKVSEVYQAVTKVLSDRVSFVPNAVPTQPRAEEWIQDEHKTASEASGDSQDYLEDKTGTSAGSSAEGAVVTPSIINDAASQATLSSSPAEEAAMPPASSSPSSPSLPRGAQDASTQSHAVVAPHEEL